MKQELADRNVESDSREKMFDRAKKIYNLVDRAEEIKSQIKNADDMCCRICGELTINAKNHNNFNLSTVSVRGNLAKLVLEMTVSVLNTELRFIENEIEHSLEEEIMQ